MTLRYKTAFRNCSLLVSLPCAFLLLVGAVTARPSVVIVWTAILAAWWGAYWLLHHDRRFSFAVSVGVLMLFWCPLLLQTVRRIEFVIENGGMERADGYGSPLAFLLGLVGEQWMFIPSTVTLAIAALVALGPNRAAAGDGHQGGIP